MNFYGYPFEFLKNYFVQEAILYYYQFLCSKSQLQIPNFPEYSCKQNPVHTIIRYLRIINIILGASAMIYYIILTYSIQTLFFALFPQFFEKIR